MKKFFNLSQCVFILMGILGLACLSACQYLQPEKKILQEAKLGQYPPTGPLGVAECDDYIARYQKCVTEKVPEKAKKAYREGLEVTLNYWKTQTDTPEGKMGLVTACKVAYMGSRTTMAAFGCEF
ncbi:MAG: hypothetical protein HQM15_11215 [Deltaproteobacteria bacterium]|nr:hypothetical protein [Deltaproteobacteria bacterium]